MIGEQKVKNRWKSSFCNRQKVKFVFDIEVFVGFKTFSSYFHNFYFLNRLKTGKNRLNLDDNRLLIRDSRNQNLARGLN